MPEPRCREALCAAPISREHPVGLNQFCSAIRIATASSEAASLPMRRLLHADPAHYLRDV